jgi:hypothetical protein
MMRLRWQVGDHLLLRAGIHDGFARRERDGADGSLATWVEGIDRCHLLERLARALELLEQDASVRHAKLQEWNEPLDLNAGHGSRVIHQVVQRAVTIERALRIDPAEPVMCDVHRPRSRAQRIDRRSWREAGRVLHFSVGRQDGLG